MAHAKTSNDAPIEPRLLGFQYPRRLGDAADASPRSAEPDGAHNQHLAQIRGLKYASTFGPVA